MKNFRTWLKVAAVFQLITAVIHATTLFITPVPKNETERQLQDLMHNYQMDMGGFHPTMREILIALSTCFSLVCLLGGLLNLFLLRKNLKTEVLTGILNINLTVFAICFGVMAYFTFLPPIVLTGIVFVTLILARVTINNNAD